VVKRSGRHFTNYQPTPRARHLTTRICCETNHPFLQRALSRAAQAADKKGSLRPSVCFIHSAKLNAAARAFAQTRARALLIITFYDLINSE